MGLFIYNFMLNHNMVNSYNFIILIILWFLIGILRVIASDKERN